MQLIQLTEPSPEDKKKTMSTIRESLETNQLNGIDKSIVTNKISLNKNDTVAKTDEDVKNENTINKQWDEKVKDLDGIAITNGDAQNEDQIVELDNNDIVLGNTECGSSANGQSNGSSTFSEHCKSPINISVDISSTIVEKLTNLEDQISNDSIKNVDIEEVKSDQKIADFSVENSTTVNNDLLDTQANVGIEKCFDDELKNIDISDGDQNMSKNVSAFSPNSDVDEKEINISAQLQQLEDDATIEDNINQSTDVKIATEYEQNILQKQIEDIELENAAVSMEEKENEIEATTTSQKEINDGDNKIEKDVTESQYQKMESQINEAPKVSIEKQPQTKEDKLGDEKNDQEFIFEKVSTDVEPENCSVSLVTEAVESNANMEVVGQEPDRDITDEINDDASKVAIENQSVKNDFKDINSDSVMEVDDIKLVSIEEKLKNSINVNSEVDETASVPKYIRVRSFSDMTDQKTILNDEISEENQLTRKDQIKQNKIMDVDETHVVSLFTPENSISSEIAAIQTNKIEKETAEENQSISDNEKDTTAIIKKKDLEVTEEKYIKDNENEVMEIDDVDNSPIIGFNTADIIEAQNIIEDKSDEETAKQEVLINITDKENEEFHKSEHTDSEVKNGSSEVISIDESVKDTDNLKKLSEVEIMDKEDVTAINKNTKVKEKTPEKKVEKKLPVVCKLSNTMDILSDDEDDNPILKSSGENDKKRDETKKIEESKCINIDDDDDNDIMFIEDTNSQGPKDEENRSDQQSNKADSQTNEATDDKTNTDTCENEKCSTKIEDMAPKIIEKDNSTPIEIISQIKEDKTIPVELSEIKDSKPPLLTKSFLKSVTKNLADMTRNELEDFCILKLVESVVDKSNLNETKNKMKIMALTVEDLRKKTLALIKQNRDLQVVVKTVQEDQKKRNTNTMMPMKITRSVGMQVVLTGAGDKSILKKKLSMPIQTPQITPARPVRNLQSPKTQKQIANNIPVPRLVPASSPTVKPPATPVITVSKPAMPTIRNATPQRPEKRPHTKLSSPSSSVTVDLTDDEPPAKLITKNPAPPVRLVPSQNLMPVKNKPIFGPTGNSPRKVYIPISSNNQNIRPGAGVIKNFVSPSLRPRQPSVVRMQTVRLNQAPSPNRHPAPLPDAMKQYQPPTWKALPPAPDLKLSKVDNGIVISWKFEGYQPDTYEEVASFQLYAYQETPAPPSTALWKKIGDIKALPLPMACTLTQFMSGFKYYFAVRAIDVRSRIGPFSLPGSIMLISKS